MSASMENVLGAVFQQFTNVDEENYDGLRQILSLNQATNLFSFQSLSSIQEVLSHTHKCLSSSKRRIEGLMLLGQIVQQCSTDVFQQSASTWVNLLVQILQSHCTAPVYRSTCLILSKVIYYAKNFTDISRDVVVSALPQIIPTLLSAPSELRPAAVSCINSTIKAYSGPIGPFKNKLEALVLSELDNGITQQEVIQCFSLLPQCGPAGALGSKHAEAWISQCGQTVASLEQTLDCLYDGLETDTSSSRKGISPLKLDTIDADDPNRVASLTSRWKCLSSCLIGLLSEGQDSTVKIPVEDVLQLVCRSLAINSKMLLNKPTTERTLLAAHLTSIHLCGLDILEKLILVCGKSLVPHFSVIIGLMSQQLTWTQTEKTGHVVLHGCLREKVYRVLSVWLKITTGSSGVHIEEKNLIKQIIHDCTPVSESLKLSGSGQTAQHQETTGKKKKHKGYQEISHGISSQKKVHLNSNHGLIAAGLDALYWLILTSGTEMDKQPLQEVQKFCIGTVLCLQQTYLNRFLVPYGSSECRRGLYRVLYACTVTSHPEVPPPTQCATGIFRSGLQDQCIEVSSFCTEAMRTCELLIHPRAPCLNGPIRVQDTIVIGENGAQTCEKINENGLKTSQQLGSVDNGDFLNQRKELSSNFDRNSVELGVNSSNLEATVSSRTFQNRKRSAEVLDNDKANEVGTKLIKIDSKQDSAKSGTSSDVTGILVEEDNDDSDSDENDDNDEEDDAIMDSTADNSKIITNTTDSIKGLERAENDEDEKISDALASIGDVAPDEMFTATKIDKSSVDTPQSEKIKEPGEDKIEEASSGEKGESQADKKEDSKEVEAMMMSFIDAEPDSD